MTFAVNTDRYIDNFVDILPLHLELGVLINTPAWDSKLCDIASDAVIETCTKGDDYIRLLDFDIGICDVVVTGILPSRGASCVRNWGQVDFQGRQHN